MTTTMTHNELAKLFADEDAAREHLEKLRWANGIVCPHCGVKEQATKLEPREGSKRPVRKGVYKCRACRKQFTVTVGTIFHRSHIPLNVWLHVFHLVCSSKKGMSAHQIHRMTGITYKSAWFMVHRIREAMTPNAPEAKLTGTNTPDMFDRGALPSSHPVWAKIDRVLESIWANSEFVDPQTDDDWLDEIRSSWGNRIEALHNEFDAGE